VTTKRGFVLKAAGAAVAVVLIAGLAMATVPDSSHVIHGCYNPKQNNKLRVIDTDKGQKCAAGEKPLNWNQTGPPGPSGGPTATSFTTPVFLGRAAPCGPMVEATWAHLADQDTLGTNVCAGSSDTATVQNTVAFDPSDFPPTVTGNVTGVVQLIGEGTLCTRMYDYTTSAAVGTYSCLVNDTPGSQPTLVFATPVAAMSGLSSGTHRLGLQVKFHNSNPCGCDVYDVRLVVDW
jgi:hypothetical protein